MEAAFHGDDGLFADRADVEHAGVVRDGRDGEVGDVRVLEIRRDLDVRCERVKPGAEDDAEPRLDFAALS